MPTLLPPNPAHWCGHVVLLAAILVTTPLAAAETVLLEDDFQSLDPAWQPLVLSGSGNAVSSVHDGQLEFSVAEPGTVAGVYHPTPLSGNFYVETAYAADDAVQVVLLALTDGAPDLDNYTGMAVTTRDDIVHINQYDCHSGAANRHDPHNKVTDARYHATLDGKSYGIRYTGTNGRLRILREALSNTFHFYYGTHLDRYGISSDDWLELAPQYSWQADDQQYVVALLCRNEPETNAVREVAYRSVRVVQTPVSDIDDTQTGFAVRERPYHWSGHPGRATVVTFDEAFPFDREIKFTFWDRANNAPAWRIDNDFMLNFEFFEGMGDLPGCRETMSDRQRHGQSVTIIEDNAVRKIVRWHGIPLNPDYHYWGHDLGGDQIPTYDEYWTFYPDGIATRQFIDTPKLDVEDRRPWGPEVIECMPIGGTTVKAGDLCAKPALTLLDLEDTENHYFPQNGSDFKNNFWGWDQTIFALHFRHGTPDFFLAISQADDTPDTWCGIRLKGQMTWHDTDHKFSHWPVGREPWGINSGNSKVYSYATHRNEVTHTSLVSAGFYGRGQDFDDHYLVRDDGRRYRQTVMLVGVTAAQDFQAMRDHVQTWVDPGSITMIDTACSFIGNNRVRRELVFRAQTGERHCAFTLDPSRHAVRNPTLRIDDWGTSGAISITVNGDPVPFRSARIDEALLIWLNTAIDASATVIVDGQAPARAIGVEDIPGHDWECDPPGTTTHVDGSTRFDDLDASDDHALRPVGNGDG